MKKARRTSVGRSIALAATLAFALAACWHSPPAAPNPNPTTMKLTLAEPGACVLNAVRMCQALTSAPARTRALAAQPPLNYPISTAPEEVELQIPAGQAIELTCYHEPVHGTIVKAEARATEPLTENSVAFLKKQAFCRPAAKPNNPAAQPALAAQNSAATPAASPTATVAAATPTPSATPTASPTPAPSTLRRLFDPF